ncbi:3-oxoacyl-[acyl-carrier-protein] synthase III C-terminal domain-containing protein [Dickeya lacustris]|uniref:3-oxoacyl-ACP synthase n=1 Tax=Dickeya lacustris TaxID=2259638 RepID=A0ABY8G3F0_9GAMM|nr:3-oxoacyl-[acyl-carrier-protein] synthase III C-terminal domain-containing protein [Dickeya lacustris]WFN54468.1 3-oxoacyl-ACP synthase [Dickeya lacustris]
MVGSSSQTDLFCLNAIHHAAPDQIQRIPLEALGESHQLRDGQRRVMEKLYQLRTVPMHPASHQCMLEETLAGLLADRPSLREQRGLLVYAKTQTHNTLFDSTWLDDMLNRQQLAQWEAVTFSLNHCASALSALHLFRQSRRYRQQPLLLLTGEKAFHPEINRFSVGLQGELPVAALFNASPGSYRVTFTAVRHLSQFYQNPGKMSRQEKAQLNACLLDALCLFVAEAVSESGLNMDAIDYFVPCNLNVPLLNQMALRLNMGERLFSQQVSDYGHLYCSDVLFNFSSLMKKTTGSAKNYFCFSMGMGVTLSCALIQQIDS